MAIEARIHFGDEGTVFEMLVKDENNAILDISSATLLEIDFVKPDGSVSTKTATFVTDGTDGLMAYNAEAGFIDRTGDWIAQGHVEMPGWLGSTTEDPFTVYARRRG